MKLGIVGPPNVSKSTLFNSLIKAGAESASYPFYIIDPNVGVVPVPDARLDKLTATYSSEKATPVVIEFVNIASLVEGTSRGRGLDNQFLSNIREIDAIVHVVHCFGDPNVIHTDGCTDPLYGIETINLELIFSDIEVLERHAAKQSRGTFNNKDLVREVELPKVIRTHLEDGKLVRSFEPDDDDARRFINTLNLLIWKPTILIASVTEDDLADDDTGNQYIRLIRGFADENNCEIFIICAEIEQEIVELDDDEKEMSLDGLGPIEPGLEKLIATSYRILDPISYLTAGLQESHVRTVRVGAKVSQAAGEIHGDFERGFIRAEIVNYDDLVACGSVNAAKGKGLIRSEGREYVMRDDNVVLLRFNI